MGHAEQGPLPQLLSGPSAFGDQAGADVAAHPSAKPGGHSRVRQVRVPADLGGSLDALARAQNRRVSDVMRDALTDYISTHKAG